MKKFYLKFGHVIASFALFVAASNINAACSHVFYQPKTPNAAKKLRKF